MLAVAVPVAARASGEAASTASTSVATWTMERMADPSISSLGLVDVALILAAYLLGAVPFGLLLARRFAGVDVRERGSGNIGAANVARSTSKALGIATLALDAIK